MGLPAAPHHRSEEAFVLVAMASLLGGFAWFALAPDLLVGHYYRTPLFGAVHVLTLGWLSCLLFGVMIRLVPMLLPGETAPPGKGSLILWILWVVGAGGLVHHMYRGEWFGTWTAALSLLAAAILSLVQRRGLFRRAPTDAVALYAAAATGNLVLAVLAGGWIALDKHLLLLPLNPTVALSAHFHLALVGWVTVPILGFGRKLLPPLAAGPRETMARFLLLEGSLLWFAAGSLFALPGRRLAGTLLAAAMVWHLARPVARLARGAVGDPASRWASVACGTGILASLLGLALLWGAPARLGLDPAAWTTAYGWLGIVGWATGFATAIAFKLFPLWVWQERFAPDWGRRPVPAVRDLVHDGIRHAGGAIFLAGTLLGAAGFGLADPRLVRPGVWLAGLGVLFFLVNFVRVARWELLPRRFRPTPADVERFRRNFGRDPDPD